MQIITNLSSNSPASIVAQIDAEYAIHPGLGLRQAELIAYDRAKALSEYRYQSRKNEIEAAILEQKLQELRSSESRLEFEIERAELELHKLREERDYARPLLRDAVSELAVAIERKEDILKRHPEFDIPADRFQERFGTEIYQAKAVAVRNSVNKTIEPQLKITPTLNDSRPQQNYLCSE